MADDAPVKGRRLWESMILKETDTQRDPRDGEISFKRLRFIIGNNCDGLQVVDEWVRMAGQEKSATVGYRSRL